MKKPKIIDKSNEWKDENNNEWDDNEWDNEISLNKKKFFEDKPFEIIWLNNICLKQKKYRPYLTEKIKKLTYFNKYGPSSSFIKAVKRTIKISTFINKNKSTPNNFVEILDNIDKEEWNQHNINERIEILKIELKEQ